MRLHDRQYLRAHRHDIVHMVRCIQFMNLNFKYVHICLCTMCINIYIDTHVGRSVARWIDRGQIDRQIISLQAKQAAAIYFKNFLKRRWLVTDGLPGAEREAIR